MLSSSPAAWRAATVCASALLGVKAGPCRVRSTTGQVGQHDGTADWVAAFATVVHVDGQPPAVYYVGRLRAVQGKRARFADGTVLQLEASVDAPAPGGQVRAEIDPATGSVRNLVAYS
jgi:hypothetical protein